jgi:hypothetical protein
MNTYYLHNGIESSGPYTIEELAEKNITATTPVWCPGMTDWNAAAEIDTLKPLLHPTPPPLNKIVTHKRTGVQTKPVKTNFLGLSKRMFYFLFFLFFLVIITICLNLYHENRIKTMELINYETEKRNIIFKQKRTEIEERKIQMAIIEQINEERAAKERKEEIIAKLKSNKELTLEATSNYEIAKDKLEKAKNFHLFRAQDQRETEIYNAQLDCENWKREITKIENENNQLKLEYEKLPR